MIFFALFIGFACLQFWTSDASEVANAFTYGGNTVTQYPLTIFPREVVTGLTFLIPLAFVNWYPALYILDRSDPFGFPAWLQFASPLAALAARDARRARLAHRGAPLLLDRELMWSRQARPTSGGPALDRRAAGALIEVRDLERTFAVRRRTGRLVRERTEVRAVRDLTFSIGAGEMVGYIGPNGAGKSTTIKMLTGILVPTGGHLRVAGLDPSRRRTELARRIGVVFGQRTSSGGTCRCGTPSSCCGRSTASRPRAIAGTSRSSSSCSTLGDLLDTPVRQLCLGQRMRGDIAAALLHDPEILYLDEPTIGLDVVSKGRLREFLRTLNAERGTTLLLTTHDLQDIEALCRRVIVIDHGTLVFDGDLADLHRHGGSTRTLVVDLVDEAPPISVPGATTKRVEGPRQWLSFPERRQRRAARRGRRGVVRRRRPVDPGAGHRGRDPRAVRALTVAPGHPRCQSRRMKIALASDHAGYALKEEVKALLTSRGHETVDFGADDETPRRPRGPRLPGGARRWGAARRSARCWSTASATAARWSPTGSRASTPSCARTRSVRRSPGRTRTATCCASAARSSGRRWRSPSSRSG